MKVVKYLHEKVDTTVNQQTRVLAICQEDPEFLLGGMGRHLQELYAATAKRGDVTVDLLVSGPAHTSYQYHGFMKHHSNKLLQYKPQAPNMASLLITDMQLVNTLTQLIAQGKRWDLVHVHEWNSMQVAKIAREALQVPLVGTMHLCITKLMEETGQDPAKLSEADIYLMQQEGHLITVPDELILCSQAYIEMARKTFMTTRPINLIYNGIDLAKWQSDPILGARARQKFNLPDKPIALYVGRIADMKGIRQLLEAIETYADCPYTFVLSGEVNANSEAEKEGWDVTQKIKQLEQNLPDRLRWVGFQNDEDLRGLYSLAEVGLMPSLHEPFGIVALEFMAAGVPLICTEVGGLGEIVIDEHGNEYALIIEAGSPRQIRLAMAHLHEHPDDMQKLCCLGQIRVKAFNWDEIAAQTAELYHKTARCRSFKNDHLSQTG